MNVSRVVEAIRDVIKDINNSNFVRELNEVFLIVSAGLLVMLMTGKTTPVEVSVYTCRAVVDLAYGYWSLFIGIYSWAFDHIILITGVLLIAGAVWYQIMQCSNRGNSKRIRRISLTIHAMKDNLNKLFRFVTAGLTIMLMTGRTTSAEIYFYSSRAVVYLAYGFAAVLVCYGIKLLVGKHIHGRSNRVDSESDRQSKWEYDADKQRWVTRDGVSQ